MKQSRVVFLSVMVLALLLSACSTGAAATAVTLPQNTIPPMPAGSTEAVAPASGATLDVDIVNFAFDPANLTIKEGTTVAWTNQDSAVHTVTSDTGVFDSGDMANGATFSFTFTTAGTYVYHCLPHHAKMEGTITVTK